MNTKICMFDERSYLLNTLPTRFYPQRSYYDHYNIMQNVICGKFDIVFNYLKTDSDFIEDLIREKLKWFKSTDYARFGYININSQEAECTKSKEYKIKVTLTNIGILAMIAMERGYILDTKTNKIDIINTEEYYRRKLISGLYIEDAEIIKNFPEPEFKSLILDMVEFILSSTLVNGIYTN